MPVYKRFHEGAAMNKKELELRVMNYFAENINLHKYWEIARDCAREICNMKFDDIVSGGFELPSSVEIKEKVAPESLWFNASDFKETVHWFFRSGWKRGEWDLAKIESSIRNFTKPDNGCG